MNTQQPGIEDELRKELTRLGAREYEIVALTMEPKRGLAALRYALMKGAEHPISYAIKVFDKEEWHPSGEVHRRGVNLSVGATPPLPDLKPEQNLEEARKLMETLWPSDSSTAPRP